MTAVVKERGMRKREIAGKRKGKEVDSNEDSKERKGDEKCEREESVFKKMK